MAEERRFELLCPEGAAVFETAGLPIAHLLRMESRLGVEPSRSGLQPDAWPIGLRLLVGPVGLEPTIKRVLSAPRLPIPATGLNLVREERLELSRPRTLVSKTKAAAITPLPHGRGDRIRTC
jgi:hypothetical protein